MFDFLKSGCGKHHFEPVRATGAIKIDILKLTYTFKTKIVVKKEMKCRCAHEGCRADEKKWQIVESRRLQGIRDKDSLVESIIDDLNDTLPEGDS